MPTKIGSISFVLSFIAFIGTDRGYAQTPELPSYEVEKWCDVVARSAGSRSELIYGGCIEQEQSAYDELKERWASLPVQTRHWCQQVAKSGGKGSYAILNGCVEQEIAAKQENAKRQFHR